MLAPWAGVPWRILAAVALADPCHRRPPEQVAHAVAEGRAAVTSAGDSGRVDADNFNLVDDEDDDNPVEVTPRHPSKNNPDWKKFKWGYPEYTEQLSQIFRGIAVDGTTAFVPGESPVEDQGAPADEELEEEEDFVVEQSSLSTTSSRKRSSSTTSTAKSPERRTKSPVVRMMKEYMSQQNQNSVSRNEMLQNFMERALVQQEKEKDSIADSIRLAQQLTKDCGVTEDRPEFFSVGLICQNEFFKEFFFGITTPEGRLAFLQRCCRQNNLN